jgi:hypothetical protein
MALERLGGNGGSGIAVLVGAGIVYEIIAACVSSPQTMEINAGMRAPTLMKWVLLGEVQSGLFVAIAAAYDRKYAKPIVTGGVLAGIIMYGMYWHARESGLANPGPSTESYPSSRGY